MRSRRSGQAATSVLTRSQTAVERALSLGSASRAAPSVRPIARIVHQSGKDEFPPTADRRTRRVPHHRGTGGAGTR